MAEYMGGGAVKRGCLGTNAHTAGVASTFHVCTIVCRAKGSYEEGMYSGTERGESLTVDRAAVVGPTYPASCGARGAIPIPAREDGRRADEIERWQQ